MSSFDFGQKIKSAVLIPAQAWNGGTALETADALAFDTQGVEGVAVVVNTGAVTAGADLVIKFYQGDADDFTVAEASELDAKYVIKSPEMDDTANASYVHSIKTSKRYLKVQVSREGTDAAALSVVAIGGYLSKIPA